MLIFLPIFAIAGALTTLVGMFYGAREIGALNRIVRYGISSAFLITLVSSSFVYIFAETFSSWFTQDQEIISVASAIEQSVSGHLKEGNHQTKVSAILSKMLRSKLRIVKTLLTLIISISNRRS